MPTDGALIIPVLSAEGTVGAIRGRLGLAAQLELPPHISVLYPFAPPPYSHSMIDDLEELFSRVQSFTFEFRSVNRFDWRVVYLSPMPAEPFLYLTRALEAKFPSYLAYGGAFSSVIPHLTVVEDESRRVMKRAARELQGVVPLKAVASSVLLVGREAGDPTWVTHREFELAHSGNEEST